MSSHLAIKLAGKEREIRFTFPAAEQLDTSFSINLLRPSTYSDMSPRKGAALVWAGQLCNKKPLSYAQVVAALPTDTDAYYGMMETVSAAIKVALGVKETPDASKPAKQ